MKNLTNLIFFAFLIISQINAQVTGSLSFDGNNEFVEITNSPLNTIGSGDFTFEAWVKGDESQQPDHPMIFSNRGNSITNGILFFFHNQWGGSQSKLLSLQIDGFNHKFVNNGSFNGSLLDNECHHVAISRKGNMLSFYADGVLFGTTNTTSSATANNNEPLWIGQDQLTNNTFNGNISQCRIWNVARTETEILESKDISLQGDETGLLAYWEMNDGTGQMVSDKTGQYDGQLGNENNVDQFDPTWSNDGCVKLSPIGEFGCSKYFISYNNATPVDAQAVAQQSGGYLAVINDQAENDFLQQHISEMAYIGLDDTQTEGSPVWENGDAVSYTNFDICSFCNGNSELDDYVMMHNWNGGWSWSKYYNERKYIVEVPCQSTGGTPDLTLSNPTGLPATVQSGDQVTVTFDLNNIGTAAVQGDFVTAAYFSTDELFNAGDIYLEQLSQSNTPIGTVQDLQLSFSIPNVADGNYYLLIIADVNGDVTELEVSNNGLEIPIAVQSGTTTNCPPSISGFTSLGEFNGSKYFISNDNAQPVDAQAVAAQNGGYLTVINDQAENDFLQQNISEMAYIGLNDTQTEGNPVWENGDAVSYTNFEICNFCNGNTELDDYVMMHNWNGGWSWSKYYNERKYIVEIPCQPTTGGIPDLTLSNPTGLPAIIEAGDEVTITLDLNNIGTAAVQGGYSIVSYFSADEIYNSGDSYLGQLYETDTPIGTVEDLQLTLTIPNKQDGDYYILIYVNRYDQVVESDFSNNILVIPIMIQNGIDGIIPDLTLSNPTGLPATVESGDQATVIFDLNNIGTEAVNGFYSITAYFSTDETNNTGDVYLDLIYENDTPIGTIEDLELSFTIPIVANGNHYILLEVNRYSQVIESDFSNNILAIPIMVQGGGTTGGCPPDLAGFTTLGEFNGSKYFVSNSNAQPAAAQAVAQQNGGYLAVINSQAENDFLQQHISEMAYIGLNDVQTEGNLVWENGDAVSYTNFDICNFCEANTEDNDYVMMHNWNGGWSWSKFYNERKYIVEIPCGVTTSPINCAEFESGLNGRFVCGEVVPDVGLVIVTDLNIDSDTTNYVETTHYYDGGTSMVDIPEPTRLEIENNTIVEKDIDGNFISTVLQIPTAITDILDTTDAGYGGVAQNSSGEFWIRGYTRTYTNFPLQGADAIHLFKIDSDGNVLVNQQFPFVDFDKLHFLWRDNQYYGLEVLPNGEIAGYRSPVGTPAYRPLYLDTYDSNGNLISSELFTSGTSNSVPPRGWISSSPCNANTIVFSSTMRTDIVGIFDNDLRTVSNRTEAEKRAYSGSSYEVTSRSIDNDKSSWGALTFNGSTIDYSSDGGYLEYGYFGSSYLIPIVYKNTIERYDAAQNLVYQDSFQSGSPLGSLIDLGNNDFVYPTYVYSNDILLLPGCPYILDVNDNIYTANALHSNLQPTLEIEIAKTVALQKIHPNPSSNLIHVTIQSPLEQKVDLQIFDARGQLVKNIPTALYEGENVHQILITDLAEGVYSIFIPHADGKQRSMRFVKVGG